MEHNLTSLYRYKTRSDTGPNTKTTVRLCNAEGKAARMCSRQGIKWRPWRGLHSHQLRLLSTSLAKAHAS